LKLEWPRKKGDKTYKQKKKRESEASREGSIDTSSSLHPDSISCLINSEKVHARVAALLQWQVLKLLKIE
jgi:hypothetical protein